MTTIVESLGRAFLSLLAFFAFIMGAIYFVLSSVDEQKVKKIVLKEIETLTGQQLQVQGAFNFTFWPLPTVTMKEVSVVFKTEERASILVHAKTLALKLDPWVLLKMERQAFSKADKDVELEIDAFNIEDLKIHSNQSTQDYQIDKLSGHIAGLNTKKVILKKLKAQRGKSDLTGELIFQTNRVDGKLKSHYFNIKDFPITIPNLSIFFSKSKSTITALNFQFDALQSSSVLLNDMKLRTHIAGDKIILSPFSAMLAQGLIEGSIIFNQGNTDINVQANNVVLAQLLNETVGSKGLTGGKTQMRLWARGEGTTFDDIITSLTGRAFFVLKDAVLEDKTFQTSVSQLFFKFFHIFNPAIEKEKHTQIQCAALRLDLRNGMAYLKNNFGLETREFNVWGTGKINLKNKALDIELYNKPKGKLTIEIGQFAKYVHVGGTIEDPKLSFNPKGLVQEGVSVMAGIATGGISTLAEQVLKIAGGSESACESVIHKKN